MSIKTLISIAVLLLGLITAAHAVRLPFVEDALKGGSAEQNNAKQPEPAELEADWWRYFVVKGEELDKRVQGTLNRLDALLNELPANLARDARPFIELIRANLQALPQAKAQPNPEPPPPLNYQENYNIFQFLQIAERLRSVQAELEAEQADIDTVERAIKSTHRRIDTLMAAYLGTDPSNPQRLIRGLEIMAEQSSVAVGEERLRVRKAALFAKQELVKQLSNEQVIAAERLVAEPNDLIALNESVERVRTELDQAHERFINERARALSVVGENQEDKATASYRQQRAVQAAVKEGIATIRLIRLQAEKYLVSLLLDADTVDTGTVRGLLSGWDAQLTDINQRVLSWIRESERERTRAGEALAGAATDVQITTPLRLINEDRLRLAQETLVILQQLQDEIKQAGLVIQLTREQVAHKEGGLRDWWARASHVLDLFWDKAADWVTTSLFKIGGAPVTALGLLRVVLIITVAWWISHWLRHGLRQLGVRREGISLSSIYTVGRLSHYVIIAIGFMVGLSSIGIDFTNFALVAGAVAIGIGFGLQSIVNNFVSGLILLFERTLKVGDFVELASGVAGEVREIRVRSTLINTNDNIDIVVPNSEFMDTKVTNWTLLEGHCRIHLPFKVAYGTDKEMVRKAGLEAAEKLPHTLTGIPGKNPGVWLVKFGDSSLNFELVVWVTARAVKRPGAVHAAYMWELESALRKYGIEIPFPQRDLHLRSGFTDEGAQRPSIAIDKVAKAMEVESVRLDAGSRA